MNKEYTNSIPTVNEIVSGMNSFIPRSNKNNRGSSYESIATEYLLKTINELCKAMVDENNNKLMYVTNIRDNFDYRYKGGKRWLDWLNRNYPLYFMIQQGNILSKTPIPSVVKSMHSDTELLEYRLNNDFSSIYSEIPDANWITPIDTKSLTNFIMSSNKELTIAHNDKHKNKIKRNMACASEILDVAKLNNNTIPQVMDEKQSGRYYAHGINLQNSVSSTVREAALGKCYKYDMRSASYAFRLSYIKQQQPSAKTPAMIELVENKQQFRTRLAKECLTNTAGSLEHKIKLVKSALNMIGFGAKRNMFGSIKDVIWSIEDRHNLLQHWSMQELNSELELFSELLIADVGKQNLKDMLNLKKGERYSQNRAEAYLYQTAETEAMAHVFKDIKGECLLWVHDCVYTTRPQNLSELNYKLQQIPHWQYASFECEQIQPWVFYKNHNPYVLSPWEEEQQAQNYVSVFVDQHTQTEWDKQHKQQQAWREWETAYDY